MIIIAYIKKGGYYEQENNCSFDTDARDVTSDGRVDSISTVVVAVV